MAEPKEMAESKDVEIASKTQGRGVDNGVLDPKPGADTVRSRGGVLERYINLVSAVNFSFLLQSSWEVIAISFQFSLLNGGPASLFYGMIFAGTGSIIVAASLAEMASIDPTVGAQYRWSATFAPRFNRFFGLIQGWLTVSAWCFACASGFAVHATIVQALLIFNYESYNPKRWQATLLMWAFSLLMLIGNLWFRRLLKVMQSVGAICHLVFLFASTITLIVVARRSSPRYVFATLTHNLSGWNNAGVAWSIGLLGPVNAVIGFDGVLHMSDEVKKARLQVSRSIISACIMNSVLAFLYIIVLLFTLGDVDKVMKSPTGLPLIEVYWQATGSKHATNLFVVMVLLVPLVSAFNVYASTSRLTWAFARDNGLPFSDFFAKVHPTLKMPLNALALVGTIQFILAIVYIGSATAFSAFISLASLGLYLSYFFPILFFLLKRLSKNQPKYGPFRLGKFGIPLNLYALCYLVFVIIWLPFPVMLPVTRDNMNYAGPIVGACIVIAILDWCISGRKRFEVPVAPLAHDL